MLQPTIDGGAARPNTCGTTGAEPERNPSGTGCRSGRRGNVRGEGNAGGTAPGQLPDEPVADRLDEDDEEFDDRERLPPPTVHRVGQRIREEVEHHRDEDHPGSAATGCEGRGDGEFDHHGHAEGNEIRLSQGEGLSSAAGRRRTRRRG